MPRSSIIRGTVFLSALLSVSGFADICAGEEGDLVGGVAAAGLSTRVTGIKSRGDRLRTDPEFLSLRVGGGNYGAYALVSFTTLRWRYLYLDLARFFVAGGRPMGGSLRGLATGMGVALGVPWHLGAGGRHELRFGLGISGGMIREGASCEDSPDGFGRVCEYRQQTLGVILSPEVYFVARSRSGVAFQAGVDLHLATYPNKFKDDPEDAVSSDLVLPAPSFNGFVGIRF